MILISPPPSPCSRRKAAIKEELRQSFLGTRPPQLAEQCLFLAAPSRAAAAALLTAGVGADGAAAGVLGDSSMGVHLYRHADVCLAMAAPADGQEQVLLVCKVRGEELIFILSSYC